MTTTADVRGVLAALAVSDLDTSIEWLTALLGRPPSARPMEGLADWYLEGAGTVQLSVDAERAGGSMMTLVVPDIAAEKQRLAEAAIDLKYDDTTSEKVEFAELTDPDGNSVAIVEAKPGYSPQG